LQPGTTLGDIAYSSATANTNTRLPIGTAGQVLTVAAGVPSWAAPSDQTPLTTKGDLFTYSTADARLGVGANDTVLIADSSTATGLKWGLPASGGMTLLASGTLSGTSVSLTSISQGYENLIIFARDFRNSGGTNDFIVGVNSNETTRSVEFQNNGGAYQAQAQSKHYVTFNTPTVDTDAHAYIVIPDYTFTSVALVQSWAYVKASNTTESHRYVSSAYPATTAAITSVQLNSPSTWGGGTYELWGQK
jgi:hypothetical protein